MNVLREKYVNASPCWVDDFLNPFSNFDAPILGEIPRHRQLNMAKPKEELAWRENERGHDATKSFCN